MSEKGNFGPKKHIKNRKGESSEKAKKGQKSIVSFETHDEAYPKK